MCQSFFVIINCMEKKIHLEKVNWGNYRKVLKLRVTKEQENYVASNKASLIHAFLEMSVSINDFPI